MVQKPIIFLAYANDKSENGVYLRNLSKEMHGIREVLTEAVKNGLCELVERSSATISDIVDVFQDPSYSSRIAIFHYAGHADGDGLLLEGLDGSHSMAHKDGLVHILSRQQGLKLVFFNGCSSEAQTDALLTAGISAVVGTTTSINDDIATQLSIRFYKGLGLGSGIEKSWQDSISELKIANGSDTTRAVKWAGKKEKADLFPWVIKFREGSEVIKKWNFPDAAGNPLFGLPEPLSLSIPQSPFVYLNNFEDTHSSVFFGRAKYIRDLYFLCTDENAPHLILLYGQSGVGKTSLLKAGLSPRLEQSYEVVYLKRNDELGLTNTLFKALLSKCGFLNEIDSAIGSAKNKEHNILSSLELIAKKIDKEIQPEVFKIIERIREKQILAINHNDKQQAPSNLLELWNLTEQLFKKPLVVLYDQVDEAFTRPSEKYKNEVVDLLSDLKQIFSNSVGAPKGKILLCYRKEFHSDIEEQCTSIEISRSRIYLDHFRKEDILDIFQGLGDQSRLKSFYNLSIEDNLAELIASDYTRTSNESPVGPVLQILLTKMWLKAQAQNPGNPFFSVAIYKELREEGMAMEEFLISQLELIQEKIPEAYESGLALEVLRFHCTKNNTSGLKTEKEIFDHFPNSHAIIKNIVELCLELFLLLEASGAQKATVLTHDLLALVVEKYHQSSMKPVQQANRILNSRMEAIQLGSQVTLLDDYDLQIIESASPFMRLLNKEELTLVEDSKIESERKLNLAKKLRLARRIIITASIITTIVISFLFLELKTQEKQTIMSEKAAESSFETQRDNTLSLFLAVEGIEIDGIEGEQNSLKEALITSFYTAISKQRPTYKILVKSQNAFLNLLYHQEKKLIIPVPQDKVRVRLLP